MPALSKYFLILLGSTLLLPSLVRAEETSWPVGHYPLPEQGDVIGQVQVTTATQEDTLIDIGRRYGVGYEEMRRANPETRTWLPGEGTEVVVPTRFILPPGPREGVVVNVAEMRLYYYPPATDDEPVHVETYPISVGRMDWSTPLGETRIVAKVKDPAWYPPESIIKEHAERGDNLPRIVPAGPDNPLGQYAMRLDIPGYLIHGTNRPQGVGMRVTHGCIRMLPEDIERLFPKLPVGTQVRLIHAPFKLGWSQGELYVQAYPGLEEMEETSITRITEAVDAVSTAVKDRQYPVDYARLRQIVEAPNGLPESIHLVAEEPAMPENTTLYDRLEVAANLDWWGETQKTLPMAGSS
ncbi:L,D-transpeptidase family protein [Halomonas sp. WWR20]